MLAPVDPCSQFPNKPALILVQSQSCLSSVVTCTYVIRNQDLNQNPSDSEAVTNKDPRCFTLDHFLHNQLSIETPLRVIYFDHLRKGYFVFNFEMDFDIFLPISGHDRAYNEDTISQVKKGRSKLHHATEKPQTEKAFH